MVPYVASIKMFDYPQAYTPGCTAQACSFRDEFESLKRMNCQILGISTDSVSALQGFATKYRLPFVLLSDAKKSVARAYRTLLPVGKSRRVAFLIDEKGVIQKNIKFLLWKNYGKSVRSMVE